MAGEEIKLNFKISPFMEMDAKREATIRKDKNQAKAWDTLKKKLKDWPVAEKISVNPKKWNEKSLVKELLGVARMELKIFDHRVGQEIDKAKGNVAAAEKLILKHYNTAQKMVMEKITSAIDEIEQDKADDLKALKDGKAALNKVDDFDPVMVFREATAAAGKELDDFAKKFDEEMREKKRAEEGKQPWDDDNLQIAVQFCEGNLKQVREKFERDTDIGIKAIDYLEKIAEKTAKNKDVHPDLQKFGKDIQVLDKSCFAPWRKEVKGYVNSYEVVLKMISGKSLSPATLNKLKTLVANPSAGASTGGLVNKQLKDLNKRFKALEKELK